jgi:hypothetical protein
MKRGYCSYIVDKVVDYSPTRRWSFVLMEKVRSLTDLNVEANEEDIPWRAWTCVAILTHGYCGQTVFAETHSRSSDLQQGRVSG